MAGKLNELAVGYSAAIIAAAAVYVCKTGYEYVLKAKNGNGSKSVCHFNNADAAKIHIIEVSRETSSLLKPELERQTEALEDQTRVLGEIRDAVLSRRI